MFKSAEIIALAAQKKLLVAESELNRHAIAQELKQIRSATAGVADLIQPGRGRMLLLAPLAGFVLGSGGKPWKGLLKKIVIGWQLFRVAKRLMGALSTRGRGENKMEPPADPAALR